MIKNMEFNAVKRASCLKIYYFTNENDEMEADS